MTAIINEVVVRGAGDVVARIDRARRAQDQARKDYQHARRDEAAAKREFNEMFANQIGEMLASVYDDVENVQSDVVEMLKKRLDAKPPRKATGLTASTIGG